MSAAAKRNHEMGETWLDSSLRLLVFLALGLLVPTFPVQALAQSNDIALSLGGIPAQSRTLRSPAAGSTQISADVGLGANYGHRLLHAEFAALYAEIQFVALPNRSPTPATAAIVPLRLAVRHSGIAAEGPAACSTLALGSSGRRVRSVRAIRQTVKWPEYNQQVSEPRGVRLRCGSGLQAVSVFWLARRGARFCIRQPKSECGTVLEYAAQHRGQRRH